MSPPRIAVVGAGMAGLAAAQRLLSAGAEVALVERSALGGRAGERSHAGFRIESAPLLVGARDRSLQALARGAQSAGDLSPVRPVAAAQLHGGALRETDAADFAGTRRLPGMPLRDGFRLLRLQRLLRRFESLLGADQPEHATRLDDRSVCDFVRLYFGDGALERWAQPLLGADLGLDCANTSRVALLRHQVARAELGLGRLRRSVAALSAELARGARLVSGDAQAVRAANGGYALALSGGTVVEADAVVLATPPQAALRIAGDLLTPPEADVLAASRAEPALVASFAYEGALVAHSVWARVPRAESLPLAVLAIEPGAAGGFAPEGKTLVQAVATPDFSRSQLEAAGDAVAQSLAAAVSRALPGAKHGFALLEVARFAWARPCFDVGRYRALAGFARVQADRRARGRRLYFAGDFLNAPTLEGAASSGLRAAGSALADLGVVRGAMQAR